MNCVREKTRTCDDPGRARFYGENEASSLHEVNWRCAFKAGFWRC